MEKGLFDNRKLVMDIFVLIGVLATLGGVYVSKLEQAKNYGRLEEKVDGVDKRLTRIEDAVIKQATSSAAASAPSNVSLLEK